MPQLPAVLRNLSRSLSPRRLTNKTSLQSTTHTASYVSLGLHHETLEPRLLLTALDDYVAEFDPNYDFEIFRVDDEVGYQVITVDMTSQQWRSSEEVDRTLWQHWVQIVVPDAATDDTALLSVSGGRNGQEPMDLDDDELMTLIDIALTANAVVVGLPTIPNQSLTFTDDPLNPRSEDGIISYTFDKFIDEYPNLGDNTWPLLLPMVKAAVRAMDTTQTVLSNELDYEINDFVVTGGSKRGWTTWLTSAVDDRVKAIMPAVADLLNFGQQLEHHRHAYEGVTEYMIGGFSLAIGDYVAFDLPDRFQSEAGQALLEIVDPYLYRDRISIPKYLILSPGDEFFVLDSSQYYYDDLIGDKYIRFVPNTSHGLNDDAIAGAAQFFRAVVEEQELPELSWTFEDAGNTIVAQTTDNPVSVKLWQATNPESRDFRYGGGIGIPWTSSTLVDQGGGTYIANVATPETGARAFFIEMTFDSGGGSPFVFTTQVSVVGRTEGAVNVAPLAEDDTVETTVNTVTPLNVLANDDDPDGSIDPASIIIVSNPSFGSAAIDPETNQIVYTPDLDFVGTDTLVYRVRDNDATLSNLAEVTIHVDNSNLSPTAGDDAAATYMETAVLIDVLNNDSDSDGVLDPTSVSIETGPTNGVATPDPVTGEITYTPNPGFVGLDTFTYVVEDTQNGVSNAATVSVQVHEIGSGEDSIGVYNPLNGTFYLRTTNNSGVADLPAFNFGPSPSNLIPLAGDWDGDGISTIGLYNRTTGQFSLRNSNDPGTPDYAPFIVGGPQGLPIVGDWDGNGTDTVGVYNPFTATFLLVNGHSGAPGPVIQFQYGIPGWVPIAGDWDGDGSDSIGLYNAGTATFFLRNSNSTGVADVAAFNYGMPGWVPVAGDYDGDGDDTVGVVNVDTATFFLRNSNTSGVASIPGFNYGLPGWRPIIGHWQLQLPEELLVPSGLSEVAGFSLEAGLDPVSYNTVAIPQGASSSTTLDYRFVGPVAPSSVASFESDDPFDLLGAELETELAKSLSGNTGESDGIDLLMEEILEEIEL